MYVDNIKDDFYEFLTGKRVILFVHYDIDAICTCNILQSLLRFKHVLYTIIVINNLQEFRHAYEEHRRHCKFFVLINCGGTLDIVEFLEPEEECIFFLLDSHRPTDLCNVYSNGQIRLLSRPNDDLGVPDFYDVFREESDTENDESDEENDENPSKRRRFDEETLTKRREKRLWEEKRDRLLFEYSQFTYYAKASAIYMYELAWKLNRDDESLLWPAIVSLTSQYILNQIENDQYVLSIGFLQSHVTRLNNRKINQDTSTSIRISFEKDLKLILYRHWSVDESLRYSPYTVCKLRLWSTHQGEQKLHALLVDMGVPLIESVQSFRSMDMQLRQEFSDLLEKHASKHELDDICYASFVLRHGYRARYSAGDFVYIMLATLENARNDTLAERFNRALDCFTRDERQMGLAIDGAKCTMQILYRCIRNAIEMKHVINAGPFVYFLVDGGGGNCLWCAQTYTLKLLADFLQKAYVAAARNAKKAVQSPLIVSVTLDVSERALMLGVPPICENSPKSFFGKAFEQAAARIGCDSHTNFFDTSYFEIPTKDRTRFFDALTSLLS